MDEPVAPSYKKPDPIKLRFGKHLQDYRTSRGVKQVELAATSGLDRSFISEIECGNKSPSLETLESLAVAFDMSISELLKGV